MPSEISGINMVLVQGGTALTDQTSATLTSTPELAESVVKNTNFPNRLPGDQDWTLSLESQIPDEEGKDALVNGSASVDLKVDTTDDSTGSPQLETLPGVQSLTVSLDQELQEVPPGIDEATGWSYYVALRQDYEIEVEGHYYDPENDSAIYEAVHEARENGNTLEGEINVLGVTLAGSFAADDFELAAGTDDPATQTLPFMGSGGLTQTGSFESSVDGLLDLFFSQNTATVGLQHEKDETVVSGSTIWQGDAFLSSAELTLERNSFPSLSAELQGTGALSRVTQ